MIVREPRRRAVLPSLALMCVAVAAAAQNDVSLALDSFLRSALRLSGEELRAVSQGKPVPKSLDSRDNHSVAAVGLV